MPATDPFGPWMFASKTSKARSSKWEVPKGRQNKSEGQKYVRKEDMLTQTRYAVLASEEEEEKDEIIETEIRKSSVKESIQVDKDTPGEAHKEQIPTLPMEELAKAKGKWKSKNPNNKVKKGEAKQGKDKLGPSPSQIEEPNHGMDPKWKEDIKNNNQAGPSGKDTTKTTQVRSHNVVSGSMALVVKKKEKKQQIAKNEAQDITRYKKQTNDQGDKVSPAPQGESTMMVVYEPRPPDPLTNYLVSEDGNTDEFTAALDNLDDELLSMEDEDNLDDFDVVPETGQSS